MVSAGRPVDPSLGDLLAGGEKRRVVRRVECTGAGYARIEQTITRRGSRPLSKVGAYKTSDGTIVYPRVGYYYTRNPDGSLTKGQGTYQDGVPCPDCLKITPVNPEGINLDPEDWTIEFDPAVPIDIEMDVPEVPPVEALDPVPDWDMEWAAMDSGGCDSFDPYFTAEEVAFRNELFLRVWTAAGLMGDEETLKFPELTTDEYNTIRQRILDGGRTDYQLFERQWPERVSWVKRSAVDTDTQCVDPFDPGKVSYIFCLPTNDPDVTGGDGAARHYGSLIIEIRYEIPNLYTDLGLLGWSYVLGQKHRYNVTDDVVEPCDPWVLLEDEVPQDTDTNDTPDLTGGQGPTTPEGPTSPSDPTNPPTLDLPPCIRVQADGFIYCPPTTCRITPSGPTQPSNVLQPNVPKYDFRVTDGGQPWALTYEVAQSYGATHVWVPAPSYEVRPYGSTDESAWQPLTDYTILPRAYVQTVLDAFPQVNDPILNEQRAYWERLLMNAPLADTAQGMQADAVTSVLADLGILEPFNQELTSGGATMSPTDTTLSPANDTMLPEVCYEARVALDGPYPRWFTNIAGRWIEIEECCPKEDCCNETKQELASIKSMIANLTEIVLRRDAGEQTPVVDLTNIERELADIRQRIDAQPPATQYDDSRVIQRIAELESVVRETRTPAYDDTNVRRGIEEIKALVTERCEKCQPGVNYDTRFDDLEALVQMLINRPIVTGNGETQVIDTTPYYLDLQRRIDNLQTTINAGEQNDYTPLLTEIRTLIQGLRFATGTEYTENFRRLEELIAGINVGTGNGTDYSSRFNEIIERLEVIRQSTTKNYDGQLAMLLSIVQDLQSRTPVNYDDRFATLEALIRNIKVSEAANYDARFDRLETLMASLRSSYPDYTSRFNEILTAIQSLRQAGTSTSTDGPTTTTSTGTTTTGTTNCGGTTVNCGGTSDIRLDLILERLAEIKAVGGNAVKSSETTGNYQDVVSQITRYVDSMKADLLRNDDIRYEEVRRRLDDINGSIRQAQSQSTTVNTTTSPTTNAPATTTVDPRMDEVLRLLSTLQSTTGAMASTVSSVREELAVTTRNQRDMETTFESYLEALRTEIRTQGATTTTYQTVERTEEEYAYQSKMYQAAISDLQSRLQRFEDTLTQTTNQQTSGGARMVERHERIIYDYPQQAPVAPAEECYDSDCP